jgi:hypothetical protein
MGIDTSYDSLVEPLGALNQLQEKLQSDMASQHKRDAAESLRLVEMFHRAIDEKARLIEHFKSHNSVLRNSLAFLPTAADDIGKSLRQSVGDGGTLRGVSTDVSEILLKIMVFSQSPSDEAAVDIRRRKLPCSPARMVSPAWRTVRLSPSGSGTLLPLPNAELSGLRFFISIWTNSNPSMTRLATRSVICCCNRWRSV